MNKSKKSDISAPSRVYKPFRLKPIDKGTIFVFNSIHQGQYGKLLSQLEKIQEELPSRISDSPEQLTALGPFDNIIKWDVDDFSLVNQLSALLGVNSQQIQCAYRLWPHPDEYQLGIADKPFGLMCQLKIQNYLMLGAGHDIEEPIAELLRDTLQECMAEDPDISCELYGTLGWDEFLIFLRNSKGYHSLFKPIVEKIRGLTLAKLEPILGKRGKRAEFEDETDTTQKHLFISTYSTVCYSSSLGTRLEKIFSEKTGDGIPPSLRKIEEGGWPDSEMGNDDKSKINVSTRLSIKPGHLRQVKGTIRKILDLGDDNSPSLEQCSTGRYDIYPWINEEMTSRELIERIELLRYALNGNLGREEEYETIVTHSQYYNSFTIISCKYPESGKAARGATAGADSSPHSEGKFISQLKKLTVSGDDGTLIGRAAERFGGMGEHVPDSILVGLSRIFSLFDSCIRDRFTCDTFIDMLPFMKRLQAIVETAEKLSDGRFEFTYEDGRGARKAILEVPSKHREAPLLYVFHTAIKRFYRGFSQRYISSYPMMDKNETGVDFSGRLHRVLSSITGMQNLLLDDLDCHLQKGYNVISTFPSIRIQPYNFNISEANVFHLSQIESFVILFHEVTHTYIRSPQVSALTDTLHDCMIKALCTIPSKSKRKTLELIQEMACDLFLLINGFENDVELYGFWWWLSIHQHRQEIHSTLIYRYIFLLALKSEKYMKALFDYSVDDGYRAPLDCNRVLEVFTSNIKSFGYPRSIEGKIIDLVRRHFEGMSEENRALFSHNAMVLYPALNAISQQAASFFEEISYPPLGSGSEETDSCPWTPQYPLQRDNPSGTLRNQGASVSQFRSILGFIHDNREHIISDGKGILNFSPDKDELRRELFLRRISLINTLQWETLAWKKTLLEEYKIDFPMEILDSK